MVNVTDSVGTWACLSICWAPLWTDWLWVATPDNHDRLCKEDCAVLSLSAETGLCLTITAFFIRHIVPAKVIMYVRIYPDEMMLVRSSRLISEKLNGIIKGVHRKSGRHFTCIKYADIAKLCLHIWKVATRTSFSGRVAIRIEFRLWSPLGLTQEGSMVSQMDHDKR